MTEAIKTGSPPRVRGIRKEIAQGIIDNRITPACAGNTEPGICMSVSTGDHPRVCGEYGYNRRG